MLGQFIHDVVTVCYTLAVFSAAVALLGASILFLMLSYTLIPKWCAHYYLRLRQTFAPVLLILLCASPAMASDFYLNMGLGASLGQRTTMNGTWFQEGQPYKMTLADLGGKLGVGYRLSPEWALELNGISFGQMRSAGFAVPDEYYIPEKHAPKDGAPKPNHFDARQRSYGGELLARYTFQTPVVQPFLALGGFAAFNDMPYEIVDVPSGQTFHPAYRGYTVGAVGGGGLCWTYLCGEAFYYRGMGSSQYPISKSYLLPMLSVKIPF